MDLENTENEIIFQLTPQRIAADTADNRTSAPAYYISRNSFATDAKGWVDGVYYPREEQVILNKNFTLSCEEDYMILPSQVWRETEETGFGIYLYEDTEVIHVPLENANYDITVTFTNPTDNSYQALVKANNIIKAEAVEVGKEDIDVTFFSCIIKDELSLKILPGSSKTTREAAVLEKVYIKQILIRKQPGKKAGTKPTIFLASDSTVQTYHKSDCPQTGWGQVLVPYFQQDEDSSKLPSENDQSRKSSVYETKDIIIKNRAIGGRSSRSFLVEGRLDHILHEVKPGDYVFVQFGHNDATAARPNRYVSYNDFAEYLQYYIDGIRQRKATCVLVTPVARRNCKEETGSFTISFDNYRKVMLDLSEEQNIPLLDLGKESTAYLNSIGPEESKKLFLWTNPGEYPESKYAEGVSDNTHLQRKGAVMFAGIVARLIKEYDTNKQLDVLKKLLSY